MSKVVVGIDLGTTFSAIAHVNEHKKPEVIPNAEGERITPSVIMFDDNDSIIIGTTALRSAVAEPEKIVQFAKLEMGKSKEEFSKEFDGKEYSAEELSALILKKLKQDAEAYLGTEITDAVITVPVYFRKPERQATRNAGEIAGLNVLEVMNEPAAVAFAYGVDPHGSHQTVFVFNLGGGTFDVTVMKVAESDLEVVATIGDSSLGGKDWDEKIITYVADFFEVEHGENPLDDLQAAQDLQLRAIHAKEALSIKSKTTIVYNHNGNTTRLELTQEDFAELAADLLERCSALCDVVLSEAGMTWADIDTVLLAGGSTRMPMVRDMIAEISGKEINPLEVTPDDAVAIGAAIRAQSIDPDPGKEDLPDIIEIASHHLGIVTLNEQNEKCIYVMIPKMSQVPCEKEYRFRTIEDDQDELLIEVVQGIEHDRPYDEILNELVPENGEETPEEVFEKVYKLGECIIELPDGLPKGAPIDVIFQCNLDQTIEVTATCPNGSTVNVTVERKTLDDEEIKEATAHLQRMEVQSSEGHNSRRDAFIGLAYTLKSALGTLTEDQLRRLLQKAEQDYGLPQEEATQILNDSGLVVGETVNYPEVLEQRIEDIQNQSEETIRVLLKRLIRKVEWGYGLSQEEAQILNDSGLIVGKTVNYLEVLEQRIEDIQNQSEETTRVLVLEHVIHHLIQFYDAFVQLELQLHTISEPLESDKTWLEQVPLSRFRANLENVRYEFEDVLVHIGDVTSYNTEPLNEFDRKIHRVVDTIPTNDLDKDLKVAESHKVGFYTDEGETKKIFRYEEVTVYRYVLPIKQ